MERIKPETVNAINADEFARKTIEATRAFIYAKYRDHTVISRNGKVIFTDEDAAIGYTALGVLLGKDPTDTPEMPDDALVDVGGVRMAASAIDALQESMKQR